MLYAVIHHTHALWIVELKKHLLYKKDWIIIPTCSRTVECVPCPFSYCISAHGVRQEIFTFVALHFLLSHHLNVIFIAAKHYNIQQLAHSCPVLSNHFLGWGGTVPSRSMIRRKKPRYVLSMYVASCVSMLQV